MLLIDDDDQVPEQPTDGEMALAVSLGPGGLLAIDEAIVAATRPRWLKVARVVVDAIRAGGYAMEEELVRLHVRRIIALVDAGRLERRGNLHRPRFSEIRLAAASS